MTFGSVDPVASGRPHAIAEVGDGQPGSLADFLGETAFTFMTSGGTRKVCGVGASSADGVRFTEKDVEHTTKDVRVWHVRGTADGGFTAETVTAF